MIRYVPQEGVNGYNLTSHDVKPTKNIKTGSMVFETDTQNRYFFNEETSEWVKYTGPILDFYTPIARDVFCFFGLSTDEKPTKIGNQYNIGLGSIFVEIDKSKAYIYDEDGWEVVKDSGVQPVPAEVILQDKTINPTLSDQEITFDKNYDGLGTVTVKAVTSAIDSAIKAENIKEGVSILGVTGTYAPEPSEDTEAQAVYDLIDALPDPDNLTYEDADQLDSVTTAAWGYVHSKISNHDKLINCIERMNEIEIERSVKIDTDTVCTFNQAPSDNKFIAHGSYENNPITIDGTNYTTGLKMEGSDTRFSMVTFETGAESTLTLHVTPAKAIVVDNVKKTVNENGIVTVPNFQAGEHIIRKSTTNTILYAIKLEFN